MEHDKGLACGFALDTFLNRQGPVRCAVRARIQRIGERNEFRDSMVLVPSPAFSLDGDCAARCPYQEELRDAHLGNGFQECCRSIAGLLPTFCG